MMKQAHGMARFDNEKYLKEQTSAIVDRVKKFGNKLYLEFSGKLCYDYHAELVLPLLPHIISQISKLKWGILS